MQVDVTNVFIFAMVENGLAYNLSWALVSISVSIKMYIYIEEFTFQLVENLVRKLLFKYFGIFKTVEIEMRETGRGNKKRA